MKKTMGMLMLAALATCVAAAGEAQEEVRDKAEGLYLVIDLSGGPEASSYPVSYLDAVPSGGWTDEYKTTKLVMRRILAGTFTMGSPEGELGRSEDETQHQVTLTKDFYIGVFEVTQKQWERVMGDWPSCFNNTAYRDSRPVEQRSWDDIRGGTWPGGQPAAGTFMQRISARTGLSFDLPTEAQWEYACRAGTKTAMNSGKNTTTADWDTPCPNMSEVGRYDGNPCSRSVSTVDGTAKAGSYLPNAWGLYDMHGNVGEWCLDWYDTYPITVSDPLGAVSGSDRVSRGGGWNYDALCCRSAGRDGNRFPFTRYYIIGFRAARTLP
jgi:formylglycine-generating enzyme required for sulfatase activity